MPGIGEAARSAPDATAVVMGRYGQSFGELDERSRAIAGVFRAEGLERGDRVAILGANRPEVLELASAALRAGIVPVPVNVLLTAPEIEFLIEDSGARWLFTDRPFESPSLEQTITFGDAYERLLHDASPAPIADVVLGRPMHYTSGTTGTPKGVWVLPASEDLAGKRSIDFIRLWGLNSDDVHLVCSPLAHSAPLRFSIRALEAGGTVVLQERFDAAETLAAVELFGITSTFMVPTHLERILSLGDVALARHDTSSMRLLAHAGAPIREETKRRVLELFPEGSVWEFYGSTEGQATRISSAEWLRKPGSVGTPPPGGRIIVTSEEGSELPLGATGLVWIADPNPERFEYWGQEAATRRAWRRFGDAIAFTVGDLGRVDADGYLYLSGRLHDTIITGGVNVYPQEVERVLVSHPAVAEAAVYGAQHDEWGQEVRAMVVGTHGFPLDPEHLRQWARERLAGYKCPRHIDVVPELPRTATGKVKREPPFF
jgi:acyl-CoA synthetase (AMP-forming)/AMP-acid ligase II